MLLGIEWPASAFRSLLALMVRASFTSSRDKMKLRSACGKIRNKASRTFSKTTVKSKIPSRSAEISMMTLSFSSAPPRANDRLVALERSMVSRILVVPPGEVSAQA